MKPVITHPITEDIKVHPCSDWWMPMDSGAIFPVAAWGRMPDGRVLPVVVTDTGLAAAEIDENHIPYRSDDEWTNPTPNPKADPSCPRN